MLRQTSWVFAAKAVAFGGFYLMQIYIANSFTVEEWGDWSVYFSLANIILLFSNFGVGISSKRFIAQEKDGPKIGAVLRSGIKLRVITALGFTLLFLAAAFILPAVLETQKLKPLFLVSVPMLFFYNFLELSKAYFEGVYKLKYNFAVTIVEYALKAGFIIILTQTFHEIFFVALGFSAALVISGIVSIILINNVLLKKNDNYPTEEDFTKKIFVYSLPIMLMFIANSLATEIDIVMIKILKDSTEAGIYATPKNITSKIPHLTLAIAMGTLPAMAKITAENVAVIRKKIYRIFLLNVGAITFIIAVLFFGGRFIVPLLYGKEYIKSIPALYALLPFLFFISNGTYLGSFLDYQGMAGKRLINYVSALVINIGLNFWLIPKYGGVGAGIATSIAYFQYFIVNSFFVFKRLNAL